MKAVLGRLSSLVGFFFFGLRDLGPAFQNIMKEITFRSCRKMHILMMYWPIISICLIA